VKMQRRSTLEEFVTGYEIRVLGSDGCVRSTTLALHVNDYAAIRSAQKVGSDSAIEVWRDEDCIYRKPAADESAK